MSLRLQVALGFLIGASLFGCASQRPLRVAPPLDPTVTDDQIKQMLTNLEAENPLTPTNDAWIKDRNVFLTYLAKAVNENRKYSASNSQKFYSSAIGIIGTGTVVAIATALIKDKETARVTGAVGSAVTGLFSGLVTSYHWDSKAQIGESCDLYLSQRRGAFETEWSDEVIKTSNENDWKRYIEEKRKINGEIKELKCKVPVSSSDK